MTSTAQITPEQHLTIVKHLAAGKDLDTVAAITRLDRSTVLDIGSKHGYPSVEKMEWAVDVLTKKNHDARRSELPESTAPPSATARPTAGAGMQPAPAAPTGPDEFRILINTAKSHPSKRIQAQADRVLDALGRLKDLMREDQAKNAERRRVEAEKAAARAEVDRLEKELAAAKAKLRPKKPATTQATPQTDSSVSAAQLREWARGKGIDCPPVGRVPNAIREQYEAEHSGEAA